MFAKIVLNSDEKGVEAKVDYGKDLPNRKTKHTVLKRSSPSSRQYHSFHR